MGSTRTIEDYVREIVEKLDQFNYETLEDTQDTLNRMKCSSKSKHELNYWRVLQCLGEVAIEKIITAVVRIDKSSCKCHLNSNLLTVMRLFMEAMFSVAVIKRVTFFKKGLTPLYFRCIRQYDEPQLSSLGMGAMYRVILVGKTDMVELFTKYGLLKDLYQHIKTKYETEQFGHSSISHVYDCTKLLHAVSVYGTENIRRQVKRHAAIRVLSEYVSRLKLDRGGVQELISEFAGLRHVLSDEKVAQIALKSWKTKNKLREHLGEEEEFIFCSSPSCRKRESDLDKFQYCGACRLSRYCSEICQKDHWKNGHKDSCLKQPGTVVE